MVIVAVKKIMKYILGRFSQRKHYHMDLFLVKICYLSFTVFITRINKTKVFNLRHNKTSRSTNVVKTITSRPLKCDHIDGWSDLSRVFLKNIKCISFLLGQKRGLVSLIVL